MWPCIYINYEPNETSEPDPSVSEQDYWNLNWQYPLSYDYTTITSNYSNSHPAIDLPAPNGTPIYAAQSGIVVYNKLDYSGGNMITIKSDSYAPNTGRQIIYNYMHMRDLALKKVGERVYKGDLIGYVGKTGNATGEHLHFETFAPINFNLHALGAINYPGQTIDPKLFYGCI